MILDLGRYHEFLVRYKITPNQFMFIQMIMHKRYAMLYEYCTVFGGFSPEELQDLVKKGYLKHEIPEEEKQATTSEVGLYGDHFTVTESFMDQLFIKDDEQEMMFEQFWSSYPKFLMINGKRVPTKSTNKEEFEKIYLKYIKKSLPLHLSIVQAVEWGKSKGYINSNIVNFFNSRGWEDILQDMKAINESSELPSEQYV